MPSARPTIVGLEPRGLAPPVQPGRDMIELVWDATRRGTGRASSGASLSVGEGTHFSSADLVCLAAASCLMQSVLALADADQVPLLSYLSTAELVDVGQGTRPRVRIRTYVATTSPSGREQVASLVTRAQAASPISCLLGDRLDVVCECHVLSGPARGSPS